MGILLITQGPLHERSQGFTVAMPAGRAGQPVQPDNEGVTAARWSRVAPLKNHLKKIDHHLLCHVKMFYCCDWTL